MDVAISRHLEKSRKIFKKNLLFSSVFMLWFCQKSCTDKALCSISYLTEILTKRVFFRHFCKSVKGPVFTGLFGLFTSYKCLILLTFWGNIFRYLRICFLICRNPSTARNQFGSNPTRVRIPLSAPTKKTHFCLPTKVRFLNYVCLRQMMLATPMMTASPNDAWLRHILGQTSHHCGTKWSNIIFAKQMHHIAARRCIIFKMQGLRLDLFTTVWYNKLTDK